MRHFNHDSWRGEPCIADIVCKNWVSWENGLHIGNFHPGNISINHGQPWGTQFSNNPMWQAFRTPQHTTTDKSYLNIFDHIKWILNHPSINLQFLQKVNHRQPSWLSHRFPNRSSRIQASKDSTRLPKPGNIGKTMRIRWKRGRVAHFQTNSCCLDSEAGFCG